MDARRSSALAVLLLCVVGVVATGSVAWVQRRPTATGDPSGDAGMPVPSQHAVVVAELFTSEGCSSCPPADEVLRQLVREPLEGTVVLGLGEHVDYWDHLGWRDPFSSPVFSSRQSDYQRHVFGTATIYTPQIVVDGQFEAVGSNGPAVRRAIVTAATRPKAVIELAASADAERVTVRVHVTVPPGVVGREHADAVVAVTQDHLTTDGRRGENSGRRLAHSAVVRSLTTVGSLQASGRTFDTATTVPIAADWTRSDIRIIGLLQERQS